MAINVQYKMPAALLQAERDKERRQFNRQLKLQQNQQNFQREMADRQYARQLELGQIQADRQTEQKNALYAQQTALLDSKQNAAQEMAQQQRLWQLNDRERHDAQRAEQDAEQMLQKEWQTSMLRRAAAEKNFTYSPEAQEELNRIQADRKQLFAERETLTPRQFNQAMWTLRGREMGIMPDVPIVQPNPQEEYEKQLVIDPRTGTSMIRQPDGTYKQNMPPSDTENRRAEADRMNMYMSLWNGIVGVAKEYAKSGQLPQDQFNTFVSETFANEWAKTPYGQKEAEERKKEENARMEQRKADALERRRLQNEADMRKKQEREAKSKADAMLGKEKSNEPYNFDQFFQVH